MREDLSYATGKSIPPLLRSLRIPTSKLYLCMHVLDLADLAALFRLLRKCPPLRLSSSSSIVTILLLEVRSKRIWDDKISHVQASHRPLLPQQKEISCKLILTCQGVIKKAAFAPSTFRSDLIIRTSQHTYGWSLVDLAQVQAIMHHLIMPRSSKNSQAPSCISLPTARSSTMPEALLPATGRHS